MDWPQIVTAIAQATGTFVAFVALLALIYVSQPMQAWLKRNEQYNQLDPYDCDVLKAIHESRLGLGLILLRTGDIEPIIERTSPLPNMAESHNLKVGQAFYQLSLESLESMGFLKEEKTTLSRPVRTIGSSSESYDGSEYRRFRLTGAGKQFIDKYGKKLRRERYRGSVDLTPPEHRRDKPGRREAHIRKEPPPFESTSVPFFWIKILADKKQKGSVEGLARVPGHGLGIEDGDAVYIWIKESIPQYPGNVALSAEVLRVEECGAVDNRCLRVGEHTLMKLTNIHPWRRNNG